MSGLNSISGINLYQEIRELNPNPKLFMDMGYSEAMTREIASAIRSLDMIVDQYKEIVRKTEAFAKGGDDPMVTAGDIRRMFLGELSVNLSLATADVAKMLGHIHGSVKVLDNTGAEVELAGKGTSKVDTYVSRYLIGNCKNFYKRDYMHRLFGGDA